MHTVTDIISIVNKIFLIFFFSEISRTEHIHVKEKLCLQFTFLLLIQTHSHFEKGDILNRLQSI